MKKVTLSLLILSLVFSVQAQEKGIRPMRKLRGHGDMMIQKLDFSDDQKAKLKSMNEDFRKQMSDLKNNEDITVREWKSRMKSLRDDHITKLKGLLTDEQKTKLDKLKIERKGIAESENKLRMEKMKMRLGLRDDQVAQLSKNRQELREKVRALREDKNLDMDKKREEIKQLMKDQKEKMKSVLDKDQIQKLKEDGPRKRKVVI